MNGNFVAPRISIKMPKEISVQNSNVPLMDRTKEGPFQYVVFYEKFAVRNMFI